jgi:hypothetical protein
MPELEKDRPALERAPGDLERQGLVRRTRELPGNSGADVGDTDDWWALTPSGRRSWSELDREC